MRSKNIRLRKAFTPRFSNTSGDSLHSFLCVRQSGARGLPVELDRGDQILAAQGGNELRRETVHGAEDVGQRGVEPEMTIEECDLTLQSGQANAFGGVHDADRNNVGEPLLAAPRRIWSGYAIGSANGSVEAATGISAAAARAACAPLPERSSSVIGKWQATV
jgi:hypothetical protein